ncbi:MAG: hypothetical protein PHD81_02645 [Candidatus Nanoarchaeia archaeon]|nr:hypothetical protein [Candidatus Nanoarchaeia archaeon]MDD5587984.1 hypothetical protein [Candidatus Nanoarchaeia archaeon]
MGWFTKKKREDVSLTLPKLPDLELPTYESQFENKKLELPGPEPDIPEDETHEEMRKRISLPTLKEMVKETKKEPVYSYKEPIYESYNEEPLPFSIDEEGIEEPRVEDFPQPEFKPIQRDKKMTQYKKPETKKTVHHHPKPECIEYIIPVRERAVPERIEKLMPRRVELDDKQPLFVRIENFKDALNDLENIKLRIREADLILDELNRIRLEEEKEIGSWKVELEKIKTKLLEIDRKIFESQ